MKMRDIKNHKNLVILTSLTVAAAILVGGYTAFTLLTSPSDAGTSNKVLNELTRDIDGELIGVTTGDQCVEGEGDEEDKCYQMRTALYLIDGTNRDALDQLLDNLERGDWSISGIGHEVADIRKAPGSTLNNMATEGDKEDDPSKTALALSLLTPSFFGEQGFLQQDQSVATVFAINYVEGERSESDWLYILRAGVPSEENFDFSNKVLTKLKADENKVLLTISVNE